MPNFLEYRTGVSAGCFAAKGTDFSDALAKATDALRGLDCLHATLLYSSEQNLFGTGEVLAAFTRARGWSTGEGQPG